MKLISELIKFAILLAILFLILYGIPVEPIYQERPVVEYESAMTTLDMLLPILDEQINRKRFELERRNIIALYTVNHYLEAQEYVK